MKSITITKQKNKYLLQINKNVYICKNLKHLNKTLRNNG
jgi:hypothetical protein